MAVPAVPVLKARSNSAGSVRLDITPVAGATSYKVYRRAHGSGVLTLVATITAPAVRGFDVTVTPGVLYYFSAKSHNADGDSAASSQILCFAEFTDDEGTPTGALKHERLED